MDNVNAHIAIYHLILLIVIQDYNCQCKYKIDIVDKFL